MNTKKIFSIILFQTVTLAAQAQTAQFLDNRIILERAEAQELVQRANSGNFRSRQDYPQEYARAEKMMDELYGVAQRELRSTYGQLPPKPLIFLTDRDSMVPVTSNGEIQTSNIITVDPSKLADDSAYGTMAHELSHYLLDHGRTPEDDKEIKHVYSRTDNPDNCIETTFDLAEETVLTPELNELLAVLKSTTSIHEQETGGVPIDVLGEQQNAFKILREILIVKYTQGPSDSCKLALTSLDTVTVDVYVKACSATGLQDCRLTPELQKLRDETLPVLKSHGRICLEGEYQLFLDQVEQMNGFSVKDFKEEYYENKENYSKLSSYEQQSLKLLITPANPFDILVARFDLDQQQIKKSLQKTNLKEADLRYISDEDQADLLGQILARKLPKKGLFEASRLMLMNAADIKECKSIVDSGREPSYGFLSDSHHSSCWRYWRALRFEKELSTAGNEEATISRLLKLNQEKR